MQKISTKIETFPGTCHRIGYASGIVKSKNQYQVNAAAAGILSKILVSKGDIVSKGTPLMLITNTKAKLNTENALLNAEYTSIVSNKEKFDEMSIAIALAEKMLDNDFPYCSDSKTSGHKKWGSETVWMRDSLLIPVPKTLIKPQSSVLQSFKSKSVSSKNNHVKHLKYPKPHQEIIPS